MARWVKVGRLTGEGGGGGRVAGKEITVQVLI